MCCSIVTWHLPCVGLVCVAMAEQPGVAVAAILLPSLLCFSHFNLSFTHLADIRVRCMLRQCAVSQPVQLHSYINAPVLAGQRAPETGTP